MRPDVSQKSQFTAAAAASDVAGYLPCHSKRKSLKQKKKTHNVDMRLVFL